MAKWTRWKTEFQKQDVFYTRETPFKEYIEDLRRIGFCDESALIYEKVIADHPNITLGEVMKQYPPKEGWAKAMLTVYDGKLSKEIKNDYMDLVKDEVLNYRLWKTLKHITKKERELLHSKFRGKLPNIERHL